MSNLEKLKFILSMAIADGSVAREELRLLSRRALEWGLSDDEFERVLDEAASDEAPLPDIPQDKTAADNLLKELVYMMAADGEMHDTERQMFAVIAAQMNVNESDLNEIIDQAIAEKS